VNCGKSPTGRSGFCSHSKDFVRLKVKTRGLIEGRTRNITDPVRAKRDNLDPNRDPSGRLDGGVCGSMRIALGENSAYR
jgi:hypothetical protein